MRRSRTGGHPVDPPRARPARHPQCLRSRAAVIDGGEGNDQIDAGSQNDTLSGGAGDEVWIRGDDGADQIDGGPGSDRLFPGDGTDADGPRRDGHRRGHLPEQCDTAPVSVSLDDVADDGRPGALDVHSDVEDILGGDGDDFLEGTGTTTESGAT